MASTCIASVGLCAIRVALLDPETGAPLAGLTNGIVVESAVSLQVTLEQEAGTEIKKKNGCGQLMVSLKNEDTLSGISFASKFCQLDADLIVMLTGAASIENGANTVGLQLPKVGVASGPVCFEGWSKAIDVDHQLVTPGTPPYKTFIHWVFPYTTWIQGAWTLEDDALEVDVNGIGRENPVITANGPFDDWPSYVVSDGGITRLGGWFLDDGPPDADCARIPVTSLAS